MSPTFPRARSKNRSKIKYYRIIYCHLFLYLKKCCIFSEDYQSLSLIRLLLKLTFFLFQENAPDSDWHKCYCNCRGGSMGRVQGVRAPPKMTCGFLIQLVFYKKNYVVYWCWSRARDECTPSWKKSWILPWTASSFNSTLILYKPFFRDLQNQAHSDPILRLPQCAMKVSQRF